MAKLEITIATWDYDRVRPIMDGRVKVEGCDVNFVTVYPEECFHRAWYHQDFDVTEIGLSGYIIATSLGQGLGGESPYVAIPVFLSRSFRCSGIYIRTDRGIERPEDLRGKKVGIPEYQITAAVWSRGFLHDEYGIKAEDLHWMQGGMDDPGRADKWPNNLPPGFPLTHLTGDQTVNAMLASGELDAFIGPRTPSTYRDGKTPIRRLFEDFATVEREYYKRSHVFPIMHPLGIRRSLYEKHPWLALNLYQAFSCGQENQPGGVFRNGRPEDRPAVDRQRSAIHARGTGPRRVPLRRESEYADAGSRDPLFDRTVHGRAAGDDRRTLPAQHARRAEDVIDNPVQTFETRLFIDGAFARRRRRRDFPTIDPATNETIAEVSAGGPADVDRAVAAARRAFDDGPWRRTTAAQRAKILRRLGELLEENREELARLESRDAGKPFRETADRDIPRAADNCAFFAGAIEHREQSATYDRKPFLGRNLEIASIVRDEPVGVCALLTPWNSPLMQATWKIAPALAAGNTVVLKPSEMTPLSTLMLARLAADAGVPDGVLNIVTGFGSTAGAPLVAHAGVDAVAFTGSVPTGIAINTAAASTLKKVTLELGGKSANVVFDDADLDLAVDGSVLAMFRHSGQVCLAGTRLYVQDTIYEAFLERYLARVAALESATRSRAHRIWVP